MQPSGMLLMLCCCGIVVGCSTTNPDVPHVEETVAVDEQGRTLIARDVVAVLKSVFPPGSTVFLLPSLARTMRLGRALDAQLRAAGYAIATDEAEPNGFPVGYTLDSLGDSQVRIEVTAGELLRISRLYYRTPAGTLKARTGFCGWLDPSYREGLTLRQEIPRPPRTEWKPVARYVRQGQSAPAMQRLSEEPANDEAEVSKCIAAEPASAVPPPSEDVRVQQVCQNASQETLVLEPDSDGVIEISPALFAATDAKIPNPFVQYYQPKVLANEARILVGGVVFGPHPNAILNGRVWSVGESFDGFRVEAVAQEYVMIRRDMFMLRLPVGSRETIVRYP